MHQTVKTQPAAGDDAATTGATHGVVTTDASLTNVTVLEHAFRALLFAPAGEFDEDRRAQQRLREMVLDAAAAQFLGRADGLMRAAALGGLLRASRAPDESMNWRVTHLDPAGIGTLIAICADEREAIRTLLVASARAHRAGPSSPPVARHVADNPLRPFDGAP